MAESAVWRKPVASGNAATTESIAPFHWGTLHSVEDFQRSSPAVLPDTKAECRVSPALEIPESC